jgi:hypothetical protein
MRRGKNHAAGKVIRTTLGELIVAVTDEVIPIIRDPSVMYIVMCTSWCPLSCRIS